MIAHIICLVAGAVYAAGGWPDGRETTPGNDAAACTFFPDKEVLFSYPFRSDASYTYKVMLNLRTESDSSIYAALYKGPKEVDRQPLDLACYWVFKRGSLTAAVSETGIRHVDELGVLYYLDDDEHTPRQSTEAVEETGRYVLFGKSGNKLIRERFSTAPYYAWREGEFSHESTTSKRFIFPNQPGGVKDQIVVETTRVYFRANGDDQTCYEQYRAKQKWRLEELAFVDDDQPATYRNDNGPTSVYGFPSFCSDLVIGTLPAGQEANILEASEIETNKTGDDGRKITGHWLQVGFITHYGQTGFVFSLDTEE